MEDLQVFITMVSTHTPIIFHSSHPASTILRNKPSKYLSITANIEVKISQLAVWAWKRQLVYPSVTHDEDFFKTPQGQSWPTGCAINQWIPFSSLCLNISVKRIFDNKNGWDMNCWTNSQSHFNTSKDSRYCCWIFFVCKKKKKIKQTFNMCNF